MEKLIAEITDWATTFAITLLNHVGDMLIAIVEEPGVWFAMGGAMAVTRFVKKYIVHPRHPKRALIVQATSFLVGSGFAFYTFWGRPMIVEIALSVGFAVPFVYSWGKGLLRLVTPEHKRRALDKALSSKAVEEEEYDGATLFNQKK